jgi:hypothetical protein
MFTLIRLCSARTLMLLQLPSFLAALVIAELFYKFHSFLLETAAFLATWFVIDGVVTAVTSHFRRDAVDAPSV